MFSHFLACYGFVVEMQKQCHFYQIRKKNDYEGVQMMISVNKKHTKLSNRAYLKPTQP